MTDATPRHRPAHRPPPPGEAGPSEVGDSVSGQASAGERVGAVSPARFGDPVKDAAGFRCRVLQVAVHETGHMFGMRHCTAYECGMNGSNSLEESDRAPLAFCPECEAKLWWVCSQNPSRRAAKLADFADRHGFKDEATLWRTQAQVSVSLSDEWDHFDHDSPTRVELRVHAHVRVQ